MCRFRVAEAAAGLLPAGAVDAGAGGLPARALPGPAQELLRGGGPLDQPVRPARTPVRPGPGHDRRPQRGRGGGGPVGRRQGQDRPQPGQEATRHFREYTFFFYFSLV